MKSLVACAVVVLFASVAQAQYPAQPYGMTITRYGNGMGSFYVPQTGTYGSYQTHGNQTWVNVNPGIDLQQPAFKMSPLIPMRPYRPYRSGDDDDTYSAQQRRLNFQRMQQSVYNSTRYGR